MNTEPVQPVEGPPLEGRHFCSLTLRGCHPKILDLKFVLWGEVLWDSGLLTGSLEPQLPPPATSLWQVLGQPVPYDLAPQGSPSLPLPSDHRLSGPGVDPALCARRIGIGSRQAHVLLDRRQGNAARSTLLAGSSARS